MLPLARTDEEALLSTSVESPNAVDQHPRRPAVVLVVVQDALPNGRMARFHPPPPARTPMPFFNNSFMRGVIVLSMGANSSLETLPPTPMA